MSELYHPEETSTGYLMTTVAEHLAETFAVGVVCAQPTYSSRGTVAPRREIKAGVQITRIRSTRFNKDRLLRRIVNLVAISISTFVASLRRVRRDDVVLVVTNPPLLPVVMAVVAWVKRARLAIIVHDVYPDILIAAGVLRARSLTARIINLVNMKTLRSADRIVVLGRDMRERVGARLPAEAGLRVIPNWSDTERIRHQSRVQAPLLIEHGLEDRFVIQFAGNMGRVQGLDFLIEAIELLHEDDDVHFLFVGDGSEKPKLIARAEAEGLRNVTILDWVPRSRSSEVHRACDISLISLADGMTGISVPSRLYSVMASGRPILAVSAEESEVGRVVAEEDIGWVVPPGDIAALVDAVNEAKRADLGSMGARARRAAEERYAQSVVLPHFVELVAELTR
jgi:glycosyltransferase involved in cell wall biosynthesis